MREGHNVRETCIFIFRGAPGKDLTGASVIVTCTSSGTYRGGKRRGEEGRGGEGRGGERRGGRGGETLQGQPTHMHTHIHWLTHHPP